jgi:hypothetical protein
MMGVESVLEIAGCDAGGFLCRMRRGGDTDSMHSCHKVFRTEGSEQTMVS